VAKTFKLKKDPEQVASLQARMDEVVKVVPRMAKLYDRLLSIHGFAVALSDEPDLEKLLVRGVVQDGRHVKFVAGKQSRCHTNAARLWEEDPESTVLMTGWAMSEDGIWRQHSWGKRGKTILETTNPRLLYFGFELSPEEASKFAKENID
jgi:hypothetical protein